MYANKDFAQFREADKIVSYLENPSGSVQLNVSLKKKLNLYTQIYSLKLEFKQNSYIVGILKRVNGLTDRQAYSAVSDTEYIFGKVVKINREFENAFMLEASRRNLDLANRTKNPDKISKALEVHKRIVGDEPADSDMPDMSKLQPHTYNIVISPQITTLVNELMSQGAINLSNVIPGKMIETAFKNNQPKEEEQDEH